MTPPQPQKLAPQFSGDLFLVVILAFCTRHLSPGPSISGDLFSSHLTEQQPS